MKAVTRRVKLLNRKIKFVNWFRLVLVTVALLVEVGFLLVLTGSNHPVLASLFMGSLFLGLYIFHFLQVQKINELLDPGFTEVFFEKAEELNWTKPPITDYTHSRTRLHEIAWWLNNGYRRTISVETNNRYDLDPKALNAVESEGDFLGLVIGEDILESELIDSDEFTPLLIQRIAYRRPETFLWRARRYSFFIVADSFIAVLSLFFIFTAFSTPWAFFLLPAFIAVSALSLLLGRAVWLLESERGDLAAAFLTSPERLLSALEIYSEIVDLESDLGLSLQARVDEYLSRMFQVRREGIFTTRKNWAARLDRIRSWENWLEPLDRWPLAGELAYYKGQDPRERSMARYEDGVGQAEVWDVFKLRDSKILFDKRENVTPLPRGWRRSAAVREKS